MRQNLARGRAAARDKPGVIPRHQGEGCGFLAVEFPDTESPHPVILQVAKLKLSWRYALINHRSQFVVDVNRLGAVLPIPDCPKSGC